MKCPKCGYNSFEFLDACKKCGAELGSFKKTHRISTVIRRAVAVPKADALPASPPIMTPAPVQGENLNASFDLGFPDTPPAGVKDEEFTGFAFSDDTVPPAQDSTPAAGEEFEDDFAFGEPAEDESKPGSWDIQFDETGSGMEDYERILEPGSIDSISEQPGGNVPKEAEDSGSFGTSDFDFAPEASREDIFGMESELGLPTPAEKKPQPNLEDFDKEFELIFANEDPDKSGEKTTK
ncbi:MAG: hypothetical protein PHD01_09695 [Geobacteraceae bacterium]|nr:hypothetical protein [Geobacteraceae bacterium]